MKFPGPLNLRLSLLLLCFGLLLIFVNHARNQSWLVERRIKRLEQDAYSKASRLSGMMQYLFRKPGSHRSGELEMSYASVSPDLELGVVCDSKDKVQFSSQMQWRLMDLAATPLKDVGPYMKEVRETSMGKVFHEPGDGRMTAVFPFYEGYEARASGMVIMRYNAAITLKQTREDAFYESISQACVLGAGCLLLWLALDVLVTHRVRRIMGYTRALSDGQPPPPVLDGGDELAVISQAFAQAVEKLRETELSLLEASEQERRRIGRDLHDDVCQRIAAAQLKCGVLASTLMRESAQHSGLAQEVAAELAKAAQVARGFARGLAPVWLGQGGLAPALTELAEALSQSFSIRCDCDCDLAGNELAAWVETHVYRIVQELATNAAKHARPTWVSIRVSTVDERLRAEVESDGMSFDGQASRSEGLGMKFLRQRVRALGGTLKFLPGSVAGQGSLGLCEVPLFGIHHRTSD
ncbi:MAG: hypothetical protein JWO89_1239 [Verrucomicrobiaceae bacterium]|nr:hypothetical protein [Verrucomicrobiaceae bacterium]